MAYQALARKWRPQDFSSLIGQEAIVTALRNAVGEGRIAPAYLFSGIRGVGKTTAARILAKALNCDQGPTPDPCGRCQPCREIAQGASLDVLEVDAATYSKVDQVRELTDGLRYGPARDRYRVVVLDEVHRLSRQAFDALLKIVEEPPPRLVFVFATTEIEAVPATILSRCQEYHFRRVSVPAVARHLAGLCEAEKIEASDTALRLIARAGEGSVRDSVALLDQLATFGGGRIADADAARLLDAFDPDLFHRLLAAIVAGRGTEVSSLCRHLEEEGWDPRQLFARFLAYGRDALHAALGGSAAVIDLPSEEVDRLTSLAREAGYENLLRLMNLLLASEPLVRRSEAAYLAAELAWLRAAELPKLRRVEELLSGGTPAAAAPPRSAPAAAPAPPAPATGPAAAREAPPPATPAAATPAAATPGPPSDDAPQAPPPVAPQGGSLPAAFLEAVSRRRQPLAAHLGEAQQLSFADGELVIETAPGDRWLTDALTRPANRAALDEAVAEVFGAEAGWRLAEGEPRGDRPPPPEDEDRRAKAAGDPSVQAVLDIFSGTISGVQRPAVDDEETP